MTKKSKSPKKDEIVEISKVAFKSSRQAGKSISHTEVIKKIVDDSDVVAKTDTDDVIEDRDPDADLDLMQPLDSLESLVDNNLTSEEDAIQIFRDVLSMTDDDRDSDSDGKKSPVRLMPPPPPSWTDDPNNIKFPVGGYVRYKDNPEGSVYKVCGPGTNKDTYSIKGSKMRDAHTVDGNKLIKVTDKNVNWIDYWSLYPVIPAPKPWLKKEEPKPVKTPKTEKTSKKKK